MRVLSGPGRRDVAEAALTIPGADTSLDVLSIRVTPTISRFIAGVARFIAGVARFIAGVARSTPV